MLEWCIVKSKPLVFSFSAKCDNVQFVYGIGCLNGNIMKGFETFKQWHLGNDQEPIL